MHNGSLDEIIKKRKPRPLGHQEFQIQSIPTPTDEEVATDIIDELIQELKRGEEGKNTKNGQHLSPNKEWLTKTQEGLSDMLIKANNMLELDVSNCDVCKLSFNSQEEVNSHITSVHVSVKCDYCGNIMESISDLKAHKTENHTKRGDESIQEVPTCDLCGFILQNEEQISSHAAEVHGAPLKCKECGKVLKSKAEMTSHTDRMHEKGIDTEEEEYICAECNILIRGREEMKKHEKEVHHKSKVKTAPGIVYLTPTECTKCKKYEKEDKKHENKLNEVLKATTEERQALENRLFTAQQKQFKAENDYEKLFRQHESVKDKFHNMERLNQNRLDTHKENKKLREEKEENAESMREVLRKNQILIEEVKVKEDYIKAIESEKEIEASRKQFKCTMCDWSTDNQTHMQGHQTKHKGQYICLDCKKAFTTMNILHSHRAEVHRNNTIICSKCNKQFQTNNSYKQHVNTKHVDTVPVGHQEWTPRQYEEVEYQDNTHRCPECPAQFPTKEHLKSHMDRHQDEGEYPCFQCEINFNSKIEMDEHMRSDHGQFESQKKVCRHFRQGNCLKGNQCKFWHPQTRYQSRQHNFSPACNRGPTCAFKAQNRCNYFHPGIGVQQAKWSAVEGRGRQHEVLNIFPQRGQAKWSAGEGWGKQQEVLNTFPQRGQDKLCRFQERCWNTECSFQHLSNFARSQELLENF